MKTSKNKVRSEEPAAYLSGDHPDFTEDEIIDSAQSIIKKRLTNAQEPLTSPKVTGKYLQVLLAASEHEIFGMLSLDNRNRPIAFHELFRGTIDGASVYPREVVKQALQDNAAAVVFAHNHPSGVTEPSQADIRITERLTRALGTIDVRVLDHFVVGEGITSFAEKGLI